MTDQPSPPPPSSRQTWFYPILLVLILVAGFYLRFRGLFWGEYTYLHPDERFLVWVGTDISPIVASPSGDNHWLTLSEYFDTANSPLNPYTHGHTFFVYGTLPMFLTRFTVEWIYGHSGFDVMTQVGRSLSVVADVITILLVFLAAARLYDRRVGLLAAAFSAFTVLQIQQSHFFTTDTFINLFTFLAFYFAIHIQTLDDSTPSPALAINHPNQGFLRWLRHPLCILSLAFGLAFGMAMASKINAFPMAIALPVALLVRMTKETPEKRRQFLSSALGYLLLAGFASLLVFRILQPYTFAGPGFFGLKFNPQWLENMRELGAQRSLEVDFPPVMQWARRSLLFSGQNLVLWGLGLPLGLLAATGILWATWRMMRGEWRRHILIAGWTGLYFIWQSLQSNPTMRYQLPIYPMLAIFAAWAVIRLWDLRLTIRRPKLAAFTAPAVGAVVLLATAAYAIAFSQIYVRPITRVAASRWIYQNIPGPINLHLQNEQGATNQIIPFPYTGTISLNHPYQNTFTTTANAVLTNVYLPHITYEQASSGSAVLTLQVFAVETPNQILGTASLPLLSSDDRLASQTSSTLTLDQPVLLQKNLRYALKLELTGGAGLISLAGDTLANEGEWDDGLPLRLDGYDAYDGIYPQDVNFNMYTDDNEEKLTRFQDILDRSDWIVISSNRQWGSLPRLPERFPLTTAYYRNLLGCPDDREIVWCYQVAEPGRFTGQLGYELVQTFTSEPTFGPLRLNSQFAEEAFSVYDHPKVMVFKKTNQYSEKVVSNILQSVDLSKVIRLAPLKFKSFPANLELPSDRWARQQAGGTYSDYFNSNSLHNRYQIFGVILWYLSLSLLGLAIYPILRNALPGLSDHGYPLARTAGLLLLSYLVWLAGSFQVAFTRPTITVLLALILTISGLVIYRQRTELKGEWQARHKYILMVEALALFLFLAALLIRLGNPDLWHPYKGGEKPMDFAYLNAVLKSTSFPPYDPWYAGGYLNYYYYGFVFVGVLIKWLGIMPAIAYNLLLPTIFSMIAMGAFSLGWNIYQGSLKTKEDSPDLPEHNPYVSFRLKGSAWLPAVAALLLMSILGNLGTVRMIYQGFQRLAAPEGSIDNGSLLDRWKWGISGLGKVLAGEQLPYGYGEWYWNPSRAIPAPGDVEPITEFPYFTFLYADPHAHLYSLAIALLGLGFIVSVVLSHGRWRNLASGAAGFYLGSMAIGALRPTNTWDFYTYLALGVVALGYAIWSNYQPSQKLQQRLRSLNIQPSVAVFLTGMGAIVLLIALAFLLYQPYADWYGQGYNKIDPWNGLRTPLYSYLVHWGLFLYIIASWLAWETIDWLATTPVSALRKLAPYKTWIWAILGVLAAIMLLLGLKIPGMPDPVSEGGLTRWLIDLPGRGVTVAFLIIPLAAWAATLILRPKMAESKRLVLFLVGTGLVLTLLVEVSVLRGDIARMNMVFKFYLQAWTLLAVSAGAAAGWLLRNLLRGFTNLTKSHWKNAWLAILTFLVAGAALFPITATRGKILDRMVNDAPHTLDGMLYMKYASYDWKGNMDLSQDYQAIRWMQDNVVGSPVIVEANLRDLYRWGSRFSIYTGLPGVVGWEWHQQQQRALLPGSWISQRISEIDTFYMTTNLEYTRTFLRKYNVKYIIVGQLERNVFAGGGVHKFVEQNGNLWQEVYRAGETVIYQTLENLP